MPQMSGLDFIKHIRNIDKFIPIPLVEFRMKKL